MNMSTQERPRDRMHSSEGSIRIKKLRDTARKLEPVIWIGKNGITPSVVEETRKQLKKKGLIKVKFLKSAIENRDRKELAKEIAEKTNSMLIDKVGFVAVLYREIERDKNG